MKVEIDEEYGFTPFFSKKLKSFLKDEFIKVVGMEVPSLWLPWRKSLCFDEHNNTYFVSDCLLCWYSGGAIPIKRLCWRSKSIKNYSGKEELLVDDVEIWQEGLEHWVPMLRERIPKMFRKHFWTGFRFVVEIKSMGMDSLLEIEAPTEEFEEIVKNIEASIAQWNEEDKGLIHNIYPIKSRSKKLKIRIDTGSSGEYGIKRIVEDLDKSLFKISKILISDAN